MRRGSVLQAAQFAVGSLLFLGLPLTRLREHEWVDCLGGHGSFMCVGVGIHYELEITHWIVTLNFVVLFQLKVHEIHFLTSNSHCSFHFHGLDDLIGSLLSKRGVSLKRFPHVF